jgi:CheY-like chemotaxis protein
MHAPVKDIQFQFASFDELQELLALSEEDREIDLPLASLAPQGGSAYCCADVGFTDGQWVLASFSIGECSTSVAGCVRDRGAGAQLCFADRDWETLVDFAEGAAPRSGTNSVRCPPVAENVSTEGTRILVVDPDPETSLVTQQLLQSAGYEVSATTSAEQALEVLQTSAVDLVVCECTLPGMSGLDFCRRVRIDPRLGGLPLVFLTTHTSRRRVIEAFECGVNEYVTKPFREPELSARVIGVLRRAHSRAS